MSTIEPAGPPRYEDGTRLWIAAGALLVGLLGLAFLVFKKPPYYVRTENNKGVTAPKGNPTPGSTTPVPTGSAIPAPWPTGETQDLKPEE